MIPFWPKMSKNCSTFWFHLLQSVMVSVISDPVNNQCTHASGACRQCPSFSEQWPKEYVTFFVENIITYFRAEETFIMTLYWIVETLRRGNKIDLSSRPPRRKKDGFWNDSYRLRTHSSCIHCYVSDLKWRRQVLASLMVGTHDGTSPCI